MGLTTPDKIRTLQRKLYLKAKAEPDFRFYQFYDKVYRVDILRHAYDLMRANRGAPGVDSVDFAAIEAAGLEDWLHGIETDLRTKTYQPQPVRRVMIPKPGSMASGAAFHRAYLHATQQAFLEAHEQAFAYFGGVFRVLRYD
ncbi:MAG: hypothetical protein AB7K73_16000, partial [Gammaproteobacteria bacterium]